MHGRVLSAKESWVRGTPTGSPFVFGMEEPITLIFAQTQRICWAESEARVYKNTIESALKAVRELPEWAKAKSYTSKFFTLITPALLDLGHREEVLEQIKTAFAMRSQLLLQLFLNGSVIDRLASDHELKDDAIFQEIYASDRENAFLLFKKLFERWSHDDWIGFEEKMIVALLGTPEMKALSEEKAVEYVNHFTTGQVLPIELVNFYEVDARNYGMADSLVELHQTAESLRVPLLAIVGADHHAGLAAILRDRGLQVEFKKIPRLLSEAKEAQEICKQKRRRMKCFVEHGTLEACT